MKDVLFHIDTYSEPTVPAAVDQAVAFASGAGCRLTGLAVHIDIRVPNNWLAEQLLNVNKLAAAEEAKSLEACRSMLDRFAAEAKAVGLAHDEKIVRADLNATGPCVARHARTYDLCLVGIGDRMDSQRAVAEEVVFGSGRPVLIFNPVRSPLPRELKRVVVAWDGSRSSARAASDAIPLLQKAQDVRILTVVGEKASATAGAALDLQRHFGLHGVACTIDEIDGRHRSIGASLDAYCEQYDPGLLVMGGYGSSRVKEFVLGGATEHVLNKGRVATLLSH